MIKAKSRKGKPVNLYLREEDVAKLRELMLALAERGEGTSDSLIVRAAIHAANPSKSFFDAYRAVASVDLRFKPE